MTDAQANDYGKTTLTGFRDLVVELSSTPNGAFGTILMWPYFGDVIDNYRKLPHFQSLTPPQLLNKLFWQPKYIWLTRRDKVRQAVSWVKAKQTDTWIKPKGGSSTQDQPLVFDYLCIDHHYREAKSADQNWQAYFQNNNLAPLKIVYEDMVADKVSTADRVLDYLGIPRPDTLTYENPQVQPQSSRINTDWANRYRRRRESLPTRLTVIAQRCLWYLGIGSPERRLARLR